MARLFVDPEEKPGPDVWTLVVMPRRQALVDSTMTDVPNAELCRLNMSCQTSAELGGFLGVPDGFGKPEAVHTDASHELLAGACASREY